MSSDFHPYQEVNMIAKLADLKESHYKNTLIITAIVELLTEKGILSRGDILAKAEQLELDLLLDTASNLVMPNESDAKLS
jgi:hypothetical protein